MIFHARRLPAPKLRFHPAIPSRIHDHAYKGLQAHGPFDASRVKLEESSLLFVFPSSLEHLARRLRDALRQGNGRFPGFSKLFRVPLTPQVMSPLEFEADIADPQRAARSYRSVIEAWSRTARTRDPKLAFVIVPQSERWETERPYYEAKAAFARLGIPTQMVTAELLEDSNQFGWSVANIALSSFAKLGGVPWTIEAPRRERDVVIGVGRAEIGEPPRRRIFGYAVTFVSNGMYRHTWSFAPVADEESYAARLEDAIVAALEDDAKYDLRPERLVFHLGRRTGRREVQVVRRAMKRASVSVGTAFLRLDDSTSYDLADAAEDTLAPPKGLGVRLSRRRVLLQTEGLTANGPPDGPLLIELDGRSDVGPEALDDLVEQTFRLAHANWRGFQARSRPVTLAYGELLARLVGYLETTDLWDSRLLRNELQERPWFL